MFNDLRVNNVFFLLNCKFKIDNAAKFVFLFENVQIIQRMRKYF